MLRVQLLVHGVLADYNIYDQPKPTDTTQRREQHPECLIDNLLQQHLLRR